MTFLSVRNWDKFQHYRDRRPTWIKVYIDLLDDEAHALTDAQFGQLVKLWLLAGRTDNKIPDNPVYIGHMIGTEPAELEIEKLLEKRYISRTKSQRRKRGEKWPSRYVPRKLREEVLARDEWRCVQCGASLWLEIDHVTPVSGGGRATLDNLQTLCRSCNRAKRAKTKGGLRSNQSSPLRSPEVRSSKSKKEEVERDGPDLRLLHSVCPECDTGGGLHTVDCSLRRTA